MHVQQWTLIEPYTESYVHLCMIYAGKKRAIKNKDYFTANACFIYLQKNSYLCSNGPVTFGVGRK